MRTETFRPMIDVLKPGTRGNVSVEHFEVSEAQSRFTALRPGEYVPEGKYARLMVNGHVMMSDTWMEQRSNYTVVHQARGRMLIAGLGLGMIVLPIARKPEVKSILVVEKSPDVIALIEPQISPLADGKLSVVEGDIYDWRPNKTDRFETIYFDIWEGICTDNLDGMAKLHKAFWRYRTTDGWMDSWEREVLKSRRRSEQREERMWSAFRSA